MLHTLNASPGRIVAAMRNLPVHPSMFRGVKALHATRKVETTFLLLSASNTLFVNTTLQHRCLQPPEGPLIFSEIVADSVKVTETDSLILETPPLSCFPNRHMK